MSINITIDMIIPGLTKIKSYGKVYTVTAVELDTKNNISACNGGRMVPAVKLSLYAEGTGWSGTMLQRVPADAVLALP